MRWIARTCSDLTYLNYGAAFLALLGYNITSQAAILHTKWMQLKAQPFQILYFKPRILAGAVVAVLSLMQQDYITGYRRFSVPLTVYTC